MSDTATSWPTIPAMPTIHTAGIAAAVAEAEADLEIVGLMLCGSCARGDALPGSDLDLRLFLRDGAEPRRFAAEENRDGLFIERSVRTMEAAKEKLLSRPMEVYPYLEGIALYDPDSVIEELKALAISLYAGFRAEDFARSGMANWLESAHRKIAAGLEAGTVERAAYVAATTSWTILEAVFLAADRPQPPSGAVTAYLPDACQRIGNPALTPDAITQMWAGDSPTERCTVALSVIAALLPALRGLCP